MKTFIELLKEEKKYRDKFIDKIVKMIDDGKSDKDIFKKLKSDKDAPKELFDEKFVKSIRQSIDLFR